MLQNRLQEAEMSVRTEWTLGLQAEPGIALGDAIHIAGRRHSIWHLASGFKTLKTTGRGKGFNKKGE